jgi:hypothetical protein
MEGNFFNQYFATVLGIISKLPGRSVIKNLRAWSTNGTNRKINWIVRLATAAGLINPEFSLQQST